MDTIVCIKRVPDTETRVRFSDGATVIEPEGLKYIVSPYDEFALEAALRTTEAGEKGQVTVITLGGEESQETLRAALAAGADLELDGLTFLECRVDAVVCDVRAVDEQVVALFPSDEAVALARVEPLDGSGCHVAVPFRCRSSLDDIRAAVASA